MTDELSIWRTVVFRRLNTSLADVIGARTAKAFEQLRIATVGDLLRHLPRRYLNGTELTDLTTLTEGEHVAVMARVLRAEAKRATLAGGRDRLEVVLTDGHGRLNVTFFGNYHQVNWWTTEVGKGVRGIFVGKVGMFRERAQMAHPEFVMLDQAGQIVGRSERKQLMASLSQSGLVGLYPATAKLPTWTIAECARLALDTLADAEDPWPEWVRSAGDQPLLLEALTAIHHPESRAEAQRGAERLVFDEAFATQLTMAYRRADAATHTATRRPKSRHGLLDAFDAKLPFTLTAGQEAVAATLFEELDRTRPMQRLLQGEVGSGKTIVALRAMLAVVDTGGQAALLAPTEVLAQQHYRTMRAMLGELAEGRMLRETEHATDVVLLTGSMPVAARREALLRAASGEAGIVIGTHALLSEKVIFADLGFVVVDEQHRFGVEQRAVLADKANGRPHLLVLTATPIPRSVAMTIFGDLDVSTLSEIPAGRMAVSTVVVDAASRPAWVERAWNRVAEEVGQGRQAFVVCPRIGGTGDPLTQGKGVVDLHAELVAGPLAGLRVGLLHGQLPAEVKEATMSAFAAGELDVLVSTTVIEVGVDVPNASIMIVWDAERFGISQLHQLRGRIGRGAHPGVCLLVSTGLDNPVVHQRLTAIASTPDGFALAELDLQQRREGDVLGARQSGGRSSLRLLSVLDHADLIGLTKDIAAEAVRRDPDRLIPGFADAVTQTERLTDGDWLELS